MRQEHFSEFSYGFAFTDSVVRAAGVRPYTAPCFPNLVQEATVGYDVHINYPAYPLFFQFKLSDYMTGIRAAEFAGGRCHGLERPYYRFDITSTRRSAQHQRLVEWERGRPGHVFYAAPAFNDGNAFNEAYRDGTVHLQSALVSPIDIGLLPDDEKHSVVFSPDRTIAYFCSEPKLIKSLTMDHLERQVSSVWSPNTPNLETVARKTVQDLLAQSSSALRSAADGIRVQIQRRLSTTTASVGLRSEVMETVTDLLVAREIARVSLGLEFIVAQPSDRTMADIDLADFQI